MAKTEPTTAIQSGRPAGRFKAKSRPVSTAERSPMDDSRFIARRQRASVATHVETQTRIVHTAGIPKK